MSKWVRRFTMAACALFLSTSLWAADDSDLTVTETTFRGSISKDVVWFTAYDLGGTIGTNTYVYNDSVGTNSANTDGLVECRNFTQKRTIQISIPTLGSTSIDVRIEGRAGTSTTWGEVVTKNFSAATTIDYLINAVEWVEEIRVGARSNGTAGTDSVTITGILRGEQR